MTEIDCARITRDNRLICMELERRAGRLLAREGMNAMQTHLLVYIVDTGEGGTSLTDVRREFGYSLAALSGMAKHLRELGFVRMEHCESDDRCKRIYATEKGKKARGMLNDIFRSAEREIFRGFSAEELLLLENLQIKLLGNLSESSRKKEAISS